MNILLIFFALPLATIIISIALQKIFRNPLLVAAIIFAIFLIVTFIINDLNFLVATIVYTIISFLTAVIVSIICKIIKNLFDNNNENENNCNNDNVLSESIDYDINQNQNGTTARVNIIPNYNTYGTRCADYRGYRRR